MRCLTSLFALAIAALTAVSCIEPVKPKRNGGGDEPTPESEVKITAFSFQKSKNPGLDADIACEIYDNGNILACMPKAGIDITGLIATYVVESNGSYQMFANGVAQRNGWTANDFTNTVNYQILYGNNKFANYPVRIVPYTGLPVTVIRTSDGKMPPSKEEWSTATMTIRGMGLFDDFPTQSIEIKRRGNSTFRFPKKPFSVKLAEKQPVLGMNKQKRWALLANYRDKTMMRNDVTLHIGQNFPGLEWTPDFRYTEMILNGEYVGNYLIVEQIRVDKKRVNITEMTAADLDETAITGGYMLELDAYYDEVNKFKTALGSLPVNIKEPDEETLVPAQFKYIEDYFNKTEELIRSGQFAEAYNSYIDLNSFIDFWLVQEIAGNSEANTPYSCYMYKDRGKKLFAGPLWDFDYSTYIPQAEYKFRAGRSVWIEHLRKDPVFLATAKERFHAMLPFLQTIPAYIRRQQDYLRRSAVENWKVWTKITVDDNALNGDEAMTSDAAIDRMIEGYNGRLGYLAGYFNSLP